MAQLAVIPRKCTGCGQCAGVCPFNAIEMEEGKASIGAGCRVCGLCAKNCPEKAIVRLETKTKSVNKDEWNGFLVFCEKTEHGLHPVVPELIGKAKALARGTHHTVSALVLGEHCEQAVDTLRHYGPDRIYVYDDPELSYFRAETFADCAEDCIKHLKPSVVLVGATALGRSLAPRLSTRFRTGLTADCTALELKENSDLVQIRPAFGGNIMAQIITPYTRPQFATVRYKVMDAAAREETLSGDVIRRPLPDKSNSGVRLLEKRAIPKAANISDADILVVGGRGLQKESDLRLIKDLAAALGGEYAVSRPLVEKGWESNARQIGLSGRTVRPRLLIACGISGAIQFTACMNAAEHIIAINTDKDAPIFEVAHLGLVGDLYEIIPNMIDRIGKGQGIHAEA